MPELVVFPVPRVQSKSSSLKSFQVPQYGVEALSKPHVSFTGAGGGVGFGFVTGGVGVGFGAGVGFGPDGGGGGGPVHLLQDPPEVCQVYMSTHWEGLPFTAAQSSPE